MNMSMSSALAANDAVGILRSAKSSRSSRIRGSIPGTPVVEMPDPGWRQLHVGDPCTIDVAPHGKQGGLGFLLLNESARHHETTGLRPTMGTVLEPVSYT